MLRASASGFFYGLNLTLGHVPLHPSRHEQQQHDQTALITGITASEGTESCAEFATDRGLSGLASTGGGRAQSACQQTSPHRFSSTRACRMTGDPAWCSITADLTDSTQHLIAIVQQVARLAEWTSTTSAPKESQMGV